MLRNFIKSSYRNFKAALAYNLLNVLGLTIGFTGVILVSMFLTNELQYDTFHHGHEKIYRITRVLRQLGQESRFATNEGLWDAILEQEVPSVTHSTAFLAFDSDVEFETDGKMYSAKRGLFSDEDFLKVFDFPLLFGSHDFDDPLSIIITRTFAQNLFGRDDVAGEFISWKGGGLDLKVTAVVDIPSNSSIQFEYVISGNSLSYWGAYFDRQTRQSSAMHIYFRTSTTQDIDKIQRNVNSAFESHIKKTQGFEYTTPVQRLTDVHLNSTNQSELQPGGNMNYIRLFLFIAIGLGFITIVNFISLNSSRFFQRVKEVGIRKLFGIRASSLMAHFVFETLAVTWLATFMSLALCALILIKQRSMQLNIESIDLLRPSFLFVVIASSTFIGVIVAIAPAIKVVSNQISLALTGRFKEVKERAFSIQNILVTMQLVGASCVISFALVVLRQIEYLNTKDVGYNKNNIISFRRPSTAASDIWQSFKKQLLDHTVFTAVAGSAHPPIGHRGLTPAQFKSPTSKMIAVWNFVDPGFIETMQMQIVEGRSFAKHGQDTASIIITVGAKKDLALENAIGTKLTTWFGDYEIIGVVNDFHCRPFNFQITPAVFINLDGSNKFERLAFARYHPGRHKEALQTAQQAWTSLGETSTLDFEYFDETFNRMLEKEHESRIIILFFTFVLLALTATGVVALVGHTTSKYRRQIAIRKVLGSSVNGVLRLIGRRFAIILLFATIISLPAIVWVTDFWLSDFAYKTSLQVMDVLFAWGFVAIFMVVIMARQIISAANENPVRVIRNE